MENVILNYADIKQHLAIFGIARLEIDDSSLPISLVRLLIVYVISFRGCKRRWRDFWNDTFGNNRTSRISMIFLFQSGKKKERERRRGLTPWKIYGGAGYYSGNTLEFFAWYGR